MNLFLFILLLIIFITLFKKKEKFENNEQIKTINNILSNIFNFFNSEKIEINKNISSDIIKCKELCINNICINEDFAKQIKLSIDTNVLQKMRLVMKNGTYMISDGEHYNKNVLRVLSGDTKAIKIYPQTGPEYKSAFGFIPVKKLDNNLYYKKDEETETPTIDQLGNRYVPPSPETFIPDINTHKTNEKIKNDIFNNNLENNTHDEIKFKPNLNTKNINCKELHIGNVVLKSNHIKELREALYDGTLEKMISIIKYGTYIFSVSSPDLKFRPKFRLIDHMHVVGKNTGVWVTAGTTYAKYSLHERR